LKEAGWFLPVNILALFFICWEDCLPWVFGSAFLSFLGVFILVVIEREGPVVKRLDSFEPVEIVFWRSFWGYCSFPIAEYGLMDV
jgi:hypothetical protein